MQTACDYLSLNGYKLLWGPGRHGIGHNLFAYHRSPTGLITELFAELDRMNEELGYFEPRPWHRDHPQKPKVWAQGSVRLQSVGHRARPTRCTSKRDRRSRAPIHSEVLRPCDSESKAMTPIF